MSKKYTLIITLISISFLLIFVVFYLVNNSKKTDENNISSTFRFTINKKLEEVSIKYDKNNFTPSSLPKIFRSSYKGSVVGLYLPKENALNYYSENGGLVFRDQLNIEDTFYVSGLDSYSDGNIVASLIKKDLFKNLEFYDQNKGYSYLITKSPNMPIVKQNSGTDLTPFVTRFGDIKNIDAGLFEIISKNNSNKSTLLSLENGLFEQSNSSFFENINLKINNLDNSAEVSFAINGESIIFFTEKEYNCDNVLFASNKSVVCLNIQNDNNFRGEYGDVLFEVDYTSIQGYNSKEFKNVIDVSKNGNQLIILILDEEDNLAIEKVVIP